MRLDDSVVSLLFFTEECLTGFGCYKNAEGAPFTFANIAESQPHTAIIPGIVHGLGAQL